MVSPTPEFDYGNCSKDEKTSTIRTFGKRELSFAADEKAMDLRCRKGRGIEHLFGAPNGEQKATATHIRGRRLRITGEFAVGGRHKKL